MKTNNIYPAIFTKEGNSYAVQFLDIPEAITDGNSFEEAFIHASEALGLALYKIKNPPKPTPFVKIRTIRNQVVVLVKADETDNIVEFVNEEFINVFKKQLEKKELSQYKLAKILDISESYISKIINGERMPKVDLAKRLGMLLGFDYHKYY
ncbi:MAG: type II toxin-antitoxin system HicB family antitoxin [Mycoplasmataceae bacterium]|jgi:predicted RNase H-like HicB family nuclease/DNA-binding XRE family transcriptional regulator|nr:type II toxin-antitoxin system HicB family antitoxin [Mycoplasmataceae bacterium]